ncbi:MAG TPA: lipoprotein-releasing ABC transporter permease subunit [Hyphomicrobiaceae bacterium]|nr:lipoprotein-releasing ABC transporter permease subunit [Hyphomicrobiaceae bacterium]
MTAPAVDTRPFAPFEWMLALRYLRARRKEGYISVIAVFSFLGILLGVATLIIVMAVLNGFRQELFAKILGLDGHVMVVSESTTTLADYDNHAKQLSTVPTVRRVMPVIESQAIASSSVQAVGSKVRGITEEGIKALPQVAKNIRAGTLDGFDDQQGIALGVGFMRYLHVDIGDTVTLVSPRGARTPFGTVPRVKAYKITAIFELGMPEYDRSLIFMPLTEAQHFFDKGQAVDYLDVIVDDPERAETAVASMSKLGIPGLRFVDWRERNASFFSVLQIERTAMFMILSIIIIVAAFNIISGLVMLVKDKGQEIGVLRTMGATQGAIMRVFLITGASIGVVGTLAGSLLGIVICWRIDEVRGLVTWLTDNTPVPSDIYFITRLPADLNWQTTVVVIVMSLLLSLLATVYPSWRASRLDPVEALRYE